MVPGKPLRIFIFGASSGGQSGLYIVKRIYKNIKLLGFIDNDREKHGKKIFKSLIFSPERLKKRDWDKVFICSTYWTEIKIQLELMGFVERKDFQVITGMYPDNTILQGGINLEEEIIRYNDTRPKLRSNQQWKDLVEKIKGSGEYQEYAKIPSKYIKNNIITHKKCPICRSQNFITLGRSTVSAALMLMYHNSNVQSDPMPMAVFLRLLEVFGNHGIGNDVCFCQYCGSSFLNNVLSDILKMKFVTVDSTFSSAKTCHSYNKALAKDYKVMDRDELLISAQRLVRLKRLCRSFLGPKYDQKAINVLDIGARGGALSLPLNSCKNSRFTLIESDVVFRPAIKTNATIELFNGLLHDFVRVPNRLGKYDVIIALHVLEHVVDPREFLNEIYSLLNGNGIAIVEVPYEKGSTSNRSRGRYYDWNHDHLFTPESLRTLLSILDCFEILSFEVETDAYLINTLNHCICMTAVIRKSKSSKGGMFSDNTYRRAKGLDDLTQSFAGSVLCYTDNEFYLFIRDKHDLPMIKAFAHEARLKEIITNNPQLEGVRVNHRKVRLMNANDFDAFDKKDMILFINEHDRMYFNLYCSSKPILV